MKVTQGEIVSRQTVLHVELEDEDLDPYLDRGYRRLVQRTSIPGFRKGKAPRRIVESFLGRDSLLREVIDSMLPEVTSRAIEDQGLEAGGLPSIELLEMAPITFEATVPLRPGVDLGAYAEIRVPEEDVEVTEDDVQARLEEMRNGMGTWEPVERPTQMGDLVTMDAKGTVEDRVLLDVNDAVHLLEEDGVRPFPGFSQHLVGIPLGDTKEFEAPLPDDFEDESVAGKEAHFSIALKDVKERVLPDLDDEFAKGVGDGYEDLAELRSKIETDLRTEAENAERGRYREAAMSALLEGATFELPELIVEHEVNHLRQRRQEALSRFDIRLEDYLRSMNSTEEEMNSSMQDDAEERIKRSVALDDLARVEEIEVSDEEVEQRLQDFLSEAGDGGNRPRDMESLRSSVRQVSLAEKTMDRLVAIAKGDGADSSGDGDAQSEDDQEDESERG